MSQAAGPTRPTPPRPGLADLLSGAAAVLFGAGVVAYSRTFPELGDGAPGPGLFPIVVGALLVLFGAVLVVRWLYARVRAASTSAVRTERPASRTSGRAWMDAAGVVVAVVFYLVVSDFLGFAPTMAIVLFFLSWRLGAKLLVAAGTAVVVPALIYLVFQRLLLVPLPGGLLG